MATELNFTKSDNESWGFRLTGGAEYDVPLTVIKVNEKSIAENGGLQVNDIIVRVNETPIAGLTHGEAHDVLLAAGNNLNLAIRRGEILDLTPYLRYAEEIQEANGEVEDIMEHEERRRHFEAEKVEVEAQISTQTKVTVSESESALQNHTQERKWSTFLQKPKNPKPIIKKEVSDQPKAPPYRVIIKKQPKKNNKEESKSTTEQPDNSENVREENSSEEVADNEVSVIEEEISIRAEIHEEEEIEMEVSEDNSKAEQIIEESKRDSVTERIIEEKLLEIQKQLEALARLPSTIQTTIDTVTQQLAHIVSGKELITTNEGVAENEEFDNKEVENEESMSENEEAERNLTEESYLSNEEKEQVDEDVARVSENIENEEEAQDAPEPEPALSLPESEPEIDLTEEEKEARRLEREKHDKEEKVNHWNRIWPWSDKKKPIYRESNCYLVPSKATVTKKINFLKYQPPPKNLDYLQKSEVYRLVHDMEPPVRGISSRAYKILAAEDYFQSEDPI